MQNDNENRGNTRITQRLRAKAEQCTRICRVYSRKQGFEDDLCAVRGQNVAATRFNSPGRNRSFTNRICMLTRKYSKK
jgi:hypothetical protein